MFKRKSIVLINPNYNLSENIGISSSSSESKPILLYPPLGLLYLASYAEMLGHSVSLIDMPAANIKEKEITKNLGVEPDIIGIYTNTFSLNSIRILIDRLKSDLPAKIVLGGPHLTYDSSIVEVAGVNHGFMGDSERSFTDFLRNGCNAKTSMVHPQLIENLDEIPFPSRHLLDSSRYISPHIGGEVTSMITSRGCPFDCVFCFHGFSGYKWRGRSADNVVDEIEHIANSGTDYIEMEDDLFTFNKVRIAKICEGVIKRGIKISFGCETRADFVDKNLLKSLKMAGCVNIQFGVESGSEVMRQNIGKGMSNKVLLETFKLCKEIGISTTAYFMFGHPEESYGDMVRTVEFAKELNPTFALFHLTRILPGSRLFNIAKEEGKVDEKIWEGVYNGSPVPVYVPDGVTYEDMADLQKKAWKEFYVSPRSLAKIFAVTTSATDLVVKVKSGIKILKMLYQH